MAEGLSAYVGPTATMQVRLASLLTVIDASGPELDQAETDKPGDPGRSGLDGRDIVVSR